MTQELLADLRSRINPAYQDVRGTESYERKQCADAIEALMGRLEKAEKDAERYRWLRDSEWEMFKDYWLCERHIYGEGPDELNAAIDKAMEAKP